MSSTSDDRPIVGFKSEPSHFRVVEQLSFELSGAGEHAYVQVRKTGINTTDAAARLARFAGVAGRDVGYAGMKDKWAVADQWFSLPAAELDFSGADLGAEMVVLGQGRHERKLRRGQVAANAFDVTLVGAPADLPLPARPFPNYFGPQRFGDCNLEQARSWIGRRRQRRVSRFKQGLYLSTLRSHLFNCVLAERERLANWATPVPGDVLDDAGRPTGPLWGRGRSPVSDVAAKIESAALRHEQSLLDALEHAGVDQSRRALVAEARNLSVSPAPEGAKVSFSLDAGTYATVFLAQHVQLHDRSAEV